MEPFLCMSFCCLNNICGALFFLFLEPSKNDPTLSFCNYNFGWSALVLLEPSQMYVYRITYHIIYIWYFIVLNYIMLYYIILYHIVSFSLLYRFYYYIILYTCLYIHIVDFLAFALKQEYFVFGAAIFEAAFLKVSEPLKKTQFLFSFWKDSLWSSAFLGLGYLQEFG